MPITGFDHPGDVVIEILTRLPVRSLLRFKCVCKSWYSLINNPRFVANHLSYATSIDDNHCVILKHCNRFTRRASVSFLSVSNEAVDDLSLDVPMSPPFFDDDGLGMLEVIFYGPCNGIICVFGDQISNQSSRNGDLISLWNPATREIKRLSVSNVPRQDDVEVFLIEIGFGFDSKSNEYKVVRIIDFMHRVAVGRIEVPLVEVYDLGTDCWRKIDVVVPTFMRIRYAWSTYLDGFYYWWSGDENEYSILSFNFADEVFEKIPPPDIKYPGNVTLVDYKGYVALAVDDSENLGFSDCTALWVLNRDGDKSTWSKLFKIMVPYAPIVGFLSNGKALMVDDPMEDDRMEDENFQAYDVVYEHLQLVLYDPCSQHVKHLQAYDVVYDFVLLQLINYVESLVSFKKSYEHDQEDSS